MEGRSLRGEEALSVVQTHPLPEAPWILSLLSSESIYGNYYCYYDGGVSPHADLITREPSAGGGRRRESDTILSPTTGFA